jgi:GT2 family glycosyltransferase
MNQDTIGTGTIPVPSLHDEQYNVDVYPATSITQKMDILLPSYGRLDLTIRCIEALYSFTLTPFHLIILCGEHPEDAGVPKSYFLNLQKKYNNITLCYHPKNWKTGNTFFNVGLKYCRTDLVATIMNSITVEPNWEVIALQLMESDPKIGTIGFKCLFPSGLIESAGILFNGIIPTDYGRDEAGWRHNEITEMPCVQWAFALHRKQALVGNLENDVFNGHVGWDDIDNNMCVRAKGWKVVYCGVGVGIHQSRATRGSNTAEAFLANQENAHRFWKRWGMWEKYMEGFSMDVKDLMKPETKSILTNAVTEYQVLQNLIKVCSKTLSVLSGEALKELGVSPEQYVLEMNPPTNTWNLKPRNQTESKAVDMNDTKIVPVKREIAGDGQHGDLKDTVQEVKV